MTDLVRQSLHALVSESRVALLGNYDGLHLGHQKLIQHAASVARSSSEPLTLSLISFYPHPLKVLRGVDSLPPLLSMRQKLKLLDRMGVDQLLLLRFTPAFAQQSAGDFVKRVLLEGLQVQHLVIGPDAKVGRDRQGDATFVKSEFEAQGRRCDIVEFEMAGDQKIGSREIRELLDCGKLEEAAGLLGRPYRLEGSIVHGDGRGKGMGIPTANMKSAQWIPKRGVYLSRMKLKERWIDSVTNIGIRPSFDGETLTIETHLLEYSGPDFYREGVELELLDFMRSEQKFESPDALVQTVRSDIERARCQHRDGLCE